MSNKRVDHEAIEKLSGWCLAVVRFIQSRDPENPVYEKFSVLIERLKGSGDMRGLTIVARDIQEWSAQLSEEDKVRLHEILDKDFRGCLPDRLRKK